MQSDRIIKVSYCKNGRYHFLPETYKTENAAQKFIDQNNKYYKYNLVISKKYK